MLLALRYKKCQACVLPAQVWVWMLASSRLPEPSWAAARYIACLQLSVTQACCPNIALRLAAIQQCDSSQDGMLAGLCKACHGLFSRPNPYDPWVVLLQKEVDTTIDRLEALRRGAQSDGTTAQQLQTKTQQARRKLWAER